MALISEIHSQNPEQTSESAQWVARELVADKEFQDKLVEKTKGVHLVDELQVLVTDYLTEKDSHFSKIGESDQRAFVATILATTNSREVFASQVASRQPELVVTAEPVRV